MDTIKVRNAVVQRIYEATANLRVALQQFPCYRYVPLCNFLEFGSE